MTAITTKSGQKRLDSCALKTPRWAKIAGNLRQNARKLHEAATPADAAGARLENYDKIRQLHPNSKLLGKYQYMTQQTTCWRSTPKARVSGPSIVKQLAQRFSARRAISEMVRFFTLAPIRREGPKIQDCDGIDGINRVRLTEVVRVIPGDPAIVDIKKSTDLFKAFGDRWSTLLDRGRFTSAKFSFVFEGSSKPRSVTIREDSNKNMTATLMRCWLSNGFALRGSMISNAKLM